MSEASALLELQDLDLLYSKLATKAENLPQKEQIAQLRAAAKDLASKTNKIVGERKDLETELDELNVHRKYLADKVTEVQNTTTSNYRETQDLETSLSTLAKKIEKVDFESNALLERLTLVEKAEANARSAAQQLADKEQDTVLSYKLALENIKKEVQDCIIKRDQAAKQLSPELLENYVAARKRFKGAAVEKLEGNRPSACRVSLQTSSYTELKRSGKEITTCPYCKRILVTSFGTEEQE